MDQRKQAPTDLESAPHCMSIIAQTGGTAVVPQLHGCHVEGNVIVNVNSHSEDKDGQPATDPEKRKKSIIDDQQMLKKYLKGRFEYIFGCSAMQDHRTLLRQSYTEVYITEGGSGEVNDEHEVREIERASKKQTTQETEILCNDIFTASPGQNNIRTVLTKGIAGIGKTVSVQKFILDWAEGKANQDIDFVFPLPFRDLNLKNTEFCLMELIQDYFPELTFQNNFSLEEIKSFDRKVKVLFIFDGLDECRLPLKFIENCRDVKKSTSLQVLLENLIAGFLLPSALVWITSRPAAASQIPSKFLDRVTEVRGFNDPQKEEYFRKRIRDQKQASRIISHVKLSRSLYIMCHIPVFCYISAFVLEAMLGETESGDLPSTLTEMYTHFLLLQTNVKEEKYQGTRKKNSEMSASDREFILKLGKLAFIQLEKGNLTFSADDLDDQKIDVSEASVYSGMCTEIFKKEHGIHQMNFYSFLHLSIQEYLAALYVLHSCVKKNKNVLRAEESKPRSDHVQLSELHRSAVDRALESKNGHLDLFLRFLLGLSLDSNQTLLGGLLTQTGSRSDGGGHKTNSTVTFFKGLLVWTGITSPVPDPESKPESIEKTVQYIKTKIEDESSPERTINLFHCLNELKDNSLIAEIQEYLRSGILFDCDILPHQCSALAFVLLMSEENLDEFYMKTYKSALDYERLVPVVSICRKAILNNCDLTERSFDIVASALQLSNSPLRDLDLSYNNPGDSGVRKLCTGLMSPNCKLHTLGLGWCNLTEGCCKDLASVLKTPHSELRDLELRDNELKDSGVTALSAGLEDPNCKLQRLGLSGCRITQGGCNSLASALSSNPSYLKELDLRYNYPGVSGEKALFAAKRDTLTLLVDHGGETMTKPGLRKYGCLLELDPNTAYRELSLSEGNRKVTHTEGKVQPYPDRQERFENSQVMSREILSERCYWEAEWSEEVGVARIAVTSKEIGRKGNDCTFGDNKHSWCLECNQSIYSVIHNKKRTVLTKCPSPYRHAKLPVYRVGVCLDSLTGTLSFYSISAPGKLTLLHTFYTQFPQHTPLCAGLYVWFSSASLCKLE